MTAEAGTTPLIDLGRYKLLVDSVVDYAIFMLDARGHVSSWNAGAERIKGYREPEILGKHFSCFYTDEDQANRLPERALAIAESEGRFEQEGWRVRKNGNRFWAHVVIDPIRDSTRQLIGYAKITRDLSEGHFSGESPAESEQRFRILVQGVADYAIYMLDPLGKVSSWNLGAQRIKGYSADEVLGQHFSRFYTEEDCAAGVPTAALETARTEGRFETEGWRVRKDGTQFWAHVVIDAIRSPTGALVGYAKITRDLTERKLAQEAIRRSEQQFRLLVQGVTDYAIYLLNPDGHVASWNLGAERIKGYSADEIIGKHFSCFYTAEDVAAGVPQQALETALREGKFEKESHRLRKDGSRFWAHVVIDPVYDTEGKHIGFAKITRDVTARRETEEALAEARSRLMQSQKIEAVGQLTGGIAHDFNNLLTAVLGSLELLRKRLPNDPRLTRLLDNAISGAQRGATLTQRLLAFARRQELRNQAIDLIELVRGMSDLMHTSTTPGLSIETRFPLQLRPATGDPNQLELAILNLVLNARDAMPEGGKIIISGREQTLAANNALDLRAGDYVCIAVADNGVGMDSETLAHAIEPFFTTKGVGRGTGLGLSMVHGIAEQCGGKLNLTSQKGVGTTAEIWLLASDTAVLKERPEDKSEPTVFGEALTVLIVDDDPLVLRNTAAMLEDLGHKTIEAGSGAQALQILRHPTKVDLVITDQVMPVMTGAELISQINQEWPTLKAILATGYAELPPDVGDDVQRLAKPFHQSQLAASIVHAHSDEPSVVQFPRRRISAQRGQ